ncbi:MAG: VacB/RNase II family 3'-5' exoribonuclease, partial [Myxococcaceae bacterium]
VLAHVSKSPKGPIAEIIKVLKRASKVAAQESDLQGEIDALIRNAGVETQFSNKALRAAKQFGEDPTPKDQKDRRDLKKLALCTIDGETAKDFDDAVYGYKDGKNYGVLVAIADVSHYVPERSPIDIDAYKRSTSIYYPGKCIPMIPEALSNGLCSLKPKVPRLCMTVEIIIGPSGTIKSVEVGEGVMKSQARLTYTQVQKMIDSDFKSHAKIPKAVVESIQVLQKASLALRSARMNRGSIDFDAVESVVALDETGEPVGINPAARQESNRLIEDLMIAANEAVATHLEEKGFPTIFRIHEPPNSEKLKAFAAMAQAIGALTPGHYKQLEKAHESPAVLAKLLESFKGHPAKATLETALLRSMMQARYSSNNLGHYGLASKSYLHFTSPIRRYPDLMAHRILRQSFTKKVHNPNLQEIADHCSAQERKATDLERQIHALHAAWFMQDKIGEEHEAVITGKTEFGLFARLKLHHVEGLIHISTLKGNQLAMAKIGDPVKIKVDGVNIARRHIDFSLLPSGVLAKEKQVT